MKYKELLKYFTILGLSVTVLCSQPIDTYAVEQISTTEEMVSVANESDFVIENGVLKEYTGNASQVVIPSGVTSIGKYAFNNCDSIVTVTIPSGATSIENYAFYDCDSIVTVTIPNGVETCASMFRFTASDTIRSSPLAFADINVPDSVTNCASMFRDSGSYTVVVNNGQYSYSPAFGNVKISNNVEDMGLMLYGVSGGNFYLHNINNVTNGRLGRTGNFTYVYIDNLIKSIPSLWIGTGSHLGGPSALHINAISNISAIYGMIDTSYMSSAGTYAYVVTPDVSAVYAAMSVFIFDDPTKFNDFHVDNMYTGQRSNDGEVYSAFNAWGTTSGGQSMGVTFSSIRIR